MRMNCICSEKKAKDFQEEILKMFVNMQKEDGRENSSLKMKRFKVLKQETVTKLVH